MPCCQTSIVSPCRCKLTRREKKKRVEKEENKQGQKSLKKIESLEKMVETEIEENKKGQNKIEQLEKMMKKMMAKLEKKQT